MPNIGNHVDAVFIPESVNTSTTLRITGGDLIVNTDDLVVDESTNKVGIGTNNPETKLHVSDGHIASADNFDSNIVLAVSKNITADSFAGIAINSGNNAASFIHFGDTDDSNVGRLDYSHSDNAFKFFTNGDLTERLRIESDGNVGIGTNNPDTLLNLFGTGNTTIKVHNNAAGPGTYSRLQLITGGVGSSARSEIRSLRMAAGTAETNLAFFTTIAGDTSPTENLRIESTGGLKFTGQGTLIPIGGILHHTNNNLYVRGGTNGLILSNQDNTNTIQISESDFIKFETTDGTEKLRITSSGDLLSQTGGAATYDDITGASNAGIVVGSASYNSSGVVIRTSSTGTGRLYFGDNSGNDAGRFDGYVLYAHNTRKLALGAGGATAIWVDSSQNVGIGTNNPVVLLDARRTSTTAYSSSATTNDTSFVLVNNGGGGHATIQLQSVSSGTAQTGQATITATNESASSKNTALIFGTRQNSDSTVRERLRITSSGDTSLSYNLLIPEDKKIHFEGSSADDYNAIWKADTENAVFVTSRFHIANIIDSNNDDPNAYWSVRKDGTTIAGSDELIRVQSNGNVGIGTVSPTEKIHATGNAILQANNSYIQFKNAAGAGTGYIQGQSSYLAIASGSGASNEIAFYPAATEAMRLVASGSVGIGTNNPQVLLQLGSRTSASPQGALDVVRGEVIGGGTGPAIRLIHGPNGGTQRTHSIYSYIGDLRIAADSNENMELHTGGSLSQIISSTGNVGIGTNNPTDKFTVHNSNIGNPTGITIRNTESTSTYSHARLRLESQNGAAYAHLWADVANSALRLGYNSSSTVNIDNVGRLFVGGNGTVASSSERLTVRGMAMVKNDSTNVAPLYLRNEDFTANTKQPYITLQDGSGNRGGIGVENNTSAMWISGQTGIIFRGGTSSPGNTEWARFSSNSGGSFNIGPDTVGGDPTASARFNVYGNNLIDGTMRIEPHSDKGTSVSHIHHGTTGDWYIRPATGTGKIVIADGGGNVGVGTSNPGTKLDVNGNAKVRNNLYANPLNLTSANSWIKSAYGAISNSTVSSLNNLLIGQNMRGYISGIDGGSANNSFYHTVTHGGMGYCGTEYSYNGIIKFFAGTGATTANSSFTPATRMTIASDINVDSGSKFRQNNNVNFAGGVRTFHKQGYVQGNQTLSMTFTAAGSQNSYIVMAAFNHYGLFNYGATYLAFVSTGPSGPTTNTITNNGTSLGGSWSISQPAGNQLTVSKSAGSYNGGGYWFVHILSST